MARGDRVSFLAARGPVTVQVSLNGIDGFALLVDTGAERMVISRTAAAALGIDLSRPLRFDRLVGLGQVSSTPVVRLNEVRVSASAVHGLLASVFDLPPLFKVDGLLGLNYLDRFRVTFEFDMRTLVLRVPPVPGAR